jgi:predicted metal-dependent hydrolase
VGIRPRRVRFGWDATPLHWAGDPQTTHTLNVLHLLLPAGERWFVELYRQILPGVGDERLRADVKGFIGQEVTHSRAHAAVLDHLAAQDVDTTGYTRWIDWMFDRLLGDRPFGLGRPSHGWLGRRWDRHRLGYIAAIEHLTAALGGWLLAAGAYDGDGGRGRAGDVDPVMLDMLRWHAAEEVEHRAVAFELYVDQGGTYVERLVTAAGVVPALVLLWVGGTAFLMRHDPTGPGRPTWRSFRRAGRAGTLPTLGELLRMVPRYLRPGHHPLQDGSTAAAVAYLARSPAAAAAAPSAGPGRAAAEGDDQHP